MEERDIIILYMPDFNGGVDFYCGRDTCTHYSLYRGIGGDYPVLDTVCECKSPEHLLKEAKNQLKQSK